MRQAKLGGSDRLGLAFWLGNQQGEA